MAGMTTGGPAFAPVAAFARPDRTSKVPAALLAKARAALETHDRQITNRKTIGLTDFSEHSSHPRFHIVDLASGRSTTLLVTHGSGSDPAHSGWLQSFSNRDGSNATSRGAYLTTAEYSGKYGRARRLVGLDTSNDNAMERAIVIHSAWYAEPEIVLQQQKLGRSQGCFAFSKADLVSVMDRLPPGSLLFADKL